MRKVGTKKIAVRIYHPNDPDIWVEARRMPTAEALDFFGDIAGRGKVVAVQDSEGKILHNKKSGAVETVVRGTFSADTVLEFLARVISDFSGITDEEGKLITFSKENLVYLLDDVLDVVTGPTMEDEQPYWKFIMDKVTVKETFDSDPKAKTSSALSTASGAPQASGVENA